MKEATGELNMTVVTVVAIAAVAAFFYAFVWPAVKTSITKNTRCADAVCGSCTNKNGKRVCTSCQDSAGDIINGGCTYQDTSSSTSTQNITAD